MQLPTIVVEHVDRAFNIIIPAGSAMSGGLIFSLFTFLALKSVGVSLVTVGLAIVAAVFFATGLWLSLH